jgi:hypothetical protein
MKPNVVSAVVLLAVSFLPVFGGSARAQAPTAPPPAAPGEVPSTPGARIVTGQAPVVGGNAAGARERALDDALKQAVNQAVVALVDPQTRVAQAKTLKAIEAKARSFVPRYRTLEEGEANGLYTIRLEAEVDEIALRRKIERGAATPPTAATAAKTGATAPGVLVAAADKGEATAPFVASLVTALGSAGVRARAGDPGETTPAVGAQAAARASLEQAALVTAEVLPEGLVRGTGRIAVACRANVRLVAAPAGNTLGERAATARVFVEADKAADAAGQCRAQLGADLAARLAAVRPGGGTSASGDLRVVTVDADVVEPAAIPELVKSLRGVGVVSAAELTRVTAGRAEIKVRTRAAPAVLTTALSRAAGSMITLSDVQISGADTIRVRARLRPAAAPPSAGSYP